MSYYLQGYGEGFIARNGDKYEYNVKGEVKGSYDSVDELVEANPTNNGKKDSEAKPDLATTDAADMAATGTAKDAAPKKTTKRSAKK
jgi:hypothetical protein